MATPRPHPKAGLRLSTGLIVIFIAELPFRQQLIAALTLRLRPINTPKPCQKTWLTGLVSWAGRRTTGCFVKQLRACTSVTTGALIAVVRLFVVGCVIPATSLRSGTGAKCVLAVSRCAASNLWCRGLPPDHGLLVHRMSHGYLFHGTYQGPYNQSASKEDATYQLTLATSSATRSDQRCVLPLALVQIGPDLIMLSLTCCQSEDCSKRDPSHKSGKVTP
jgi:hypothetical protein